MNNNFNGIFYFMEWIFDGIGTEIISLLIGLAGGGAIGYRIGIRNKIFQHQKDVYNSSRSTNYYHGTWSYSGNKLTLIDTEEDNYTEVWTVTTMTENELVYELREKEKEDGTTYEYYEQHAFTR